MEIKFLEINNLKRTASFSINGKVVERRIPDKFAGTLDDYLSALKAGLEIEFAEKEVIELPSKPVAIEPVKEVIKPKAVKAKK